MFRIRWSAHFVAMGLALGLMGSLAPAATAQQEKVRLKAYGCPLGSSAYIATFAMAEMLNKYSTWVHADAIETSGNLENTKTIMLDSSLRKQAFIYADPRTAHQASVGDPPFTRKYSGLRAIGLVGLMGSFWVTFDENIKTVHDFVGKRVATFARGSIGSSSTDLIFKYGLGTLDKIKFEYLGLGAGKDALLDRKVDVAIVGMAYIGKGRWVGNPAFREIFSQSRKFYAIGTPAEVIKLAQERSGYPLGAPALRAGNFGPKQPNALTLIDYRNGFWADKDLDESIVYEITRVMWEHADEFKTYHKSLASVSVETMPKAAPEKNSFHPGAIRFYEDQGVRIGYK